ncbi:MAG: hypothetical protein A2406_02270 [Candidatus Komeilibacteria bacterium RIFOXYC1_FULL_37_11]|uniref:Uncharacterized protein n=1 Tax=Candidatus Komeilibacteria bacterium RIFOXYC1_FULL_37_11 TaxID=1798555 RepID=A0A1G2C1F9_9BACT|nr:MAG: hypothetical protein A2406_02270 [Candidatus Komeilibacteria bacterium RIFOXYC1_FULL_37_11]OGY95518.1 MAG: hypothetical protein A2611_02355 [Candidatus Komeilibacteria bacterium RIFOXYD1_FULL_37_29]OGY96398.1 MAG: hypothetical protein A2543_00135 [Candidatus Komeilibacteria bacterium RIFOXYD2_FULL_37_8]
MESSNRKNTKEALDWIVKILKKHKVPFQITGGLAAKIYGSKRLLNDIDIDIPDKYFSKIIEDLKGFIVYGPKHYIDERWDCKSLTLNFNGQEIDISGGNNIKICDARTGKWEKMPTDFSASILKEIYGITIPIVSPADLIAYKSMLTGEHQKEDIEAVSAWFQA